MNNIKIKALLSVLLILTLTSCSNDFESAPFSGNLDLPTEYSYNLMITCYCTQNYVGPHKLHIKGEEIVNYEIDLDGGAVLDDQTDIKQFTIDAVVERLDDLLARDPFSKEIKVHPDYNFPTSVYFDVDERIEDEEWGYVITNFSVIED